MDATEKHELWKGGQKIDLWGGSWENCSSFYFIQRKPLWESDIWAEIGRKKMEIPITKQQDGAQRKPFLIYNCSVG